MSTATRKTRRKRMQKTRWPLSKTNGTTDSRIEPGCRTKGHLNATIVTTPGLEITETGMENTAFTAKSRTTHKKNAGRESKRTNHVKTNKDVVTGQKCM
jgi:hypothetical protein